MEEPGSRSAEAAGLRIDAVEVLPTDLRSVLLRVAGEWEGPPPERLAAREGERGRLELRLAAAVEERAALEARLAAREGDAREAAELRERLREADERARADEETATARAELAAAIARARAMRRELVVL